MKGECQMRKWICLLLGMVMLAAGTACAQEYYTLPEIREQAASGWHKAYTDKYGRETVVDIDVEVFGEDVAPVIRIKNMDDDWPDPQQLDKGAEMEERKQGLGRFLVDKDRPWGSIAPPNRSGGKRKNVHEFSNEWIDLDEQYLADYGNDMTVGEAVEFFEAFLKKHGIDIKRFVFEYPKEFNAICGVDTKTGKMKSAGFYNMKLYDQFYGLPVFTHAMDSYDNQGWPSFTPTIVFEIRNEDEYTVCIDAMKEVEKLAEDIPLCSFDKVMENLEKQIEAGKIQKVNSLRFGYSLYNEPGHPAERRDLDNWNQADYFAVPSWVIECVYIDNPKQNLDDLIRAYIKEWGSDTDEEHALAHYTQTITINAQTGEMLDPMNTDKGRTHTSPNGTGDADYKGFIPWDDVK